MKITTAIVSATLALGIAASAMAQAPSAPAGGQQSQPGAQRGMRGQFGGQPLQGLGLSSDQTQQIMTIMRTYRTDSRAIQQSSATEAEKTTKINDLKTKATEKINALLTQEQRDKAAKDGMIAKLFEARGGFGGFNIANLVSQLNLTDAQKTDVEKLVKANNEASKAINADTSLSPQAKMQKIMKNQTDLLAKVKALLTTEQQTKFDELTKRMNQRGQRGPGGQNGQRGPRGNRNLGSQDAAGQGAPVTPPTPPSN